MKESIGAKGGSEDRRRRLKITKKQRKKLELYEKERKQKELEQLEKKVKKIQRITFLKSIPIVVAGNVFETLRQNAKKGSTKENEKKKTDSLLSVNLVLEQNKNISNLQKFQLSNIVFKTDAFIIKNEDKEKSFEVNVKSEEKNQKEISKELEIKQKNQVEIIALEQTKIPIKTTVLEEVNEKQSETVVAQNDMEFERAKSQKIIDEYEKKLKDVRSDLKNLIYDYNVLVDDSSLLYKSQDIPEILVKLDYIIKKVEELKSKISIPNIDKYDDNYLYVLIEGYMNEFQNKNWIQEIKDSDLYILIAEKLEELDEKKEELKTSIDKRKEKLQIDEEKLKKLKETYFNYEKFNIELLDFQNEQDHIVEEIKEKMKHATTIYEKTEAQLEGINRNNKRLMRLLTLQMLIPGVRSAKGLVATTGLSLYFMRRILKPKLVNKRYKVIEVKDYSPDIEHSLQAIENVENLLAKTSSQVMRSIQEFKKQFQEYIEVLPQCKEILKNLEVVQEQLKEKEYEISKLKKEQKKNLEKNNEKVKTMRKEEM